MKLIAPFLIAAAITMQSCAPSRVTLTYDAVPESGGVTSFYVDGMSIAALRTDSCYASVAIPERTVIGGRPHLKVWFLYQNLSSAPYLLRPWKMVKLHVINRATGNDAVFEAATPNELLKTIDRQEASATFLSLLGGTVESVGTLSSDLPAGTKASRMSYIAHGTAADIASTGYWYSAIRVGMSAATFQKNTIFPNESANGYVYFPLLFEMTNQALKSRNYSFRLEIETPGRVVPVTFIPAELE